MKRSIPLRRRSRTGLACALVVVVSVVASACDSGTAWVARVNGATIEADHFSEALVFIEQRGDPGSVKTPGVVPVTNAAQYVLFLVQAHAMETLNQRHGSEVSDTEKAEMRTSLLATPQGASLRTAPDWFVDQLVRAQANYQTLVHYYGARVDLDARVRRYYEANKAQFQQVCLDVIAGSDESELVAARKRIADDTVDFATVARAVAEQQPPGPDGTPAQAFGEKADGDVGCIPISDLSSLFATATQVNELLEAPNGALVGPIPVAGGGFMLFRVRETKLQSQAAVRPDIEQALGPVGQSEAQQALDDYLMSLDIELNPRYGTWTPSIGYQPPQGAVHPGGESGVPISLTGEG